ncbi:MAG TPA: M23 family metallopeptidase [Solirubrobacterales bacterium]|nr:M23 family metallopeptidase [Solirubrobacterales bacterium]
MRTLDHDRASRGRRLWVTEIAVATAMLLGLAAVLAGTDEARAAAGSTAAGTERVAGSSRAGGDVPRPRVRAARVDRRRIILGARHGVAFRFELAGKRTRKVLVKVVRVGSRKVHKRFRLGRVAAGKRHRIEWSGRTRRHGWIPRGKYAFRVFADGRRAKLGARSGPIRFRFYKNRFPILGGHGYGDGLGAGRGHQGQDLFARCGRPVVAARAGRVQVRRYQSAAGYYVVVDGRGTGQDYVYMHMSRRGRPPQGARVHAGERIGTVNDTGRATGCHLHFELWTKPGWYEGGRAKSPTRALRRWDGWS